MDIIRNLLKVKSLMTVSVSAGLIYGFTCGKIDAAQFMTIAVMVFTFYFAKNDGKLSSRENTQKNNEGGGDA